MVKIAIVIDSDRFRGKKGVRGGWRRIQGKETVETRAIKWSKVGKF
jgi:hypothetical protein